MKPPALPILYSFRRCPYAIRARLALKAAGVRVELREVVLRDKPPQLLQLWPEATVPVLQCPDGRVIGHSLEIMHWALGQHDPARWLHPASSDEAARWIARNDGPFKAWLDRYKYPERHPELAAGQARDAAVSELLAPMEQQLRGSGFMLADRPGLVDMALLPFARQFARVDADWFASAPLPGLRRWLSGLLATELFTAVMHRYPRWLPGQAAVTF